jgi:hypothetical protein
MQQKVTILFAALALYSFTHALPINGGGGNTHSSVVLEKRSEDTDDPEDEETAVDDYKDAENTELWRPLFFNKKDKVVKGDTKSTTKGARGVCRMLVVAGEAWNEGGEEEIIASIGEITAFEEQLNITLKVERVIFDTNGSIIGSPPRDVNGRISIVDVLLWNTKKAEATKEFEPSVYCVVLFLHGEH